MSFLKRKSRGSFQPICSEHRIPAYYLGKQPAKGKVGLSIIQSPVATLHSQFREAVGKRVMLEVRNDGLWVKHTGEGTGGRLVRRHTVDASNLNGRTNNSFTIPVSDISFGAVDTHHRKVFAIVVQKTGDDAQRNPWECHAFLCNSHSDAKHMTLNLVASFQKNAQSKGVDVGTTSSPTTIHVFTESLSPKYQRGSASKGNVTTLKLTFNVEQIETSWNEPSEYNRNKHISKMLSERDSPKHTNADPVADEETNNQPSNNSDKENEESDSDVLEEPPAEKPRTALVAVNTGLIKLTAVPDTEDGSDEDGGMATSTDDGIPEVVQEPSPKQSRTQQKPKKKKMVRFTAEIDYIE